MVLLPHWPEIPIWQQPVDKDLTRTRALLAALDFSEQQLPPIIHIAGTNGKGSTVAMLRSIFEAAGYKVHSYTSPHLLSFNERINLVGDNISDYQLFEILEKVRTKSEELGLTPSFFEGTTIAAFLAFASKQADILLLETGMGGRLDYTNVIEQPVLTIITSISFDHMKHLGDSLELIAAEKAGIIKSGVPCVIGSQKEDVYKILLGKCNQLASPAFCYEYDYIIEEATGGLCYRSAAHSLNLPYPALLGSHQYLNASSVVAAVTLLNSKFKISNENIANGLKAVKWSGRIEKIDQGKYAYLANKNIQIYLDGAHNEGGARALAAWITDSLPQKPVYIIIGLTKNRKIETFCQAFSGLIAAGRAVKVLSEPSSYHPDVISAEFTKHGFFFASSTSLEAAIEEIAELNGDQEATLIITGSLFLVADFYKMNGR